MTLTRPLLSPSATTDPRDAEVESFFFWRGLGLERLSSNQVAHRVRKEHLALGAVGVEFTDEHEAWVRMVPQLVANKRD